MESRKSNFERNNLHEVPSYQNIFDKIRSYKVKTLAGRWIKPTLYIMVLTGARISEILLLKKSDVKWHGYNGRELYGDFTFADVASVQFNLFTEKNRKNKYRIIPVVKNDFFLEALESVYKYWKDTEYDSSYLIYRCRQTVWLAVKKALGNDYYPHLMRHISVTNDTKAGISPSILKSKFGWTDLRPHSIYSHLNWFDIQSAQETAFGNAVIKPEVKEIVVPPEYPGEAVQMTELNKKVETASWKNEKIAVRKFETLEEAMANDLRTGDAIGGKIAVVCSSMDERDDCIRDLDGNKFVIVYAKSPERKKAFYSILNKNGNMHKSTVATPQPNKMVSKQASNSAVSVV